MLAAVKVPHRLVVVGVRLRPLAGILQAAHPSSLPVSTGRGACLVLTGKAGWEQWSRSAPRWVAEWVERLGPQAAPVPLAVGPLYPGLGRRSSCRRR
jgi:hypothetical protein